MNQFNIEESYGSFLDILETELANINDEPIAHFGVKGMKWGVRKDRSSSREPLKSLGPETVVRKTAAGEEVRLSKTPPTRFQNFMGRRSEKFRKNYADQAYLTIHDGTGKKIGEAQVSKKSEDELDLVWLGINKSARGRGYATAVMKAGAEFGRQEGFKKLTLEVPTNSPDARHIYEKLGFKVVKEPTAKEMEDDIVFGGLTQMAYEINEANHTQEGMGMSYDDKPASPEELLHFGVKGMKWGVRKEQTTTGGSGGESARQKNRRLNKEFTKQEKAKRDADIDAARARYNTSARKNYLDAKAQYKQDKKTIGSRAARAKLEAVKQKNMEDYAVANQAKSGKETAFAVLGLVGGVTLLALSGSRR